MALTKSTRFRIFNRDGFTCQYCGKQPPAIVLEVDHMVSRRNGGTDDDDNLVTSCMDCNRGKSGRNAAPPSAKNLEKIRKTQREQAAQIEAYNKFVLAQRKQDDATLQTVNCRFHEILNMSLKPSGLLKVKPFLKELGLALVLECLDIAVARVDSDPEAIFRYWMGVMANKRRDMRDPEAAADRHALQICKKILGGNIRWGDSNSITTLIDEYGGKSVVDAVAIEHEHHPHYSPATIIRYATELLEGSK